MRPTPGWGGLPVAVERGLARDGTSRRVRYVKAGSRVGLAARSSPVVVRYADDLVAMCTSVEQVKRRLCEWLTPRGLAFNEDKTRIVHLDDGFDFLGFNVRRYRNKLLIKPSKAAVRRLRERLAAEMKALRGANIPAVLKRLNPIVRGWSAYYRTVASSQVFSRLDNYMWALTYKWARYSHPNKPTSWVITRHFGRFNRSRRNRWVFGDRDSLPTQVRLDQDRPTPDGPRHGVTRRPDPDRLRGPAATEKHATPGRHQPAPPTGPARSLPSLRRAPPTRRTRANHPPRMGAMAHRHPQSGPQESDHHPRRDTRHPGRSRRNPTHTRSLPATAHRHRCQPARHPSATHDPGGPA